MTGSQLLPHRLGLFQQPLQRHIAQTAQHHIGLIEVEVLGDGVGNRYRECPCRFAGPNPIERIFDHHGLIGVQAKA